MQTIFKAPKTRNFCTLSNNFADSGMDPVAKAILLYLLAKPSDWQLNTSHMKKLLNLTYYKVKKGLKELKRLGHLSGCIPVGAFGGFTSRPHRRPPPPSKDNKFLPGYL